MFRVPTTTSNYPPFYLAHSGYLGTEAGYLGTDAGYLGMEAGDLITGIMMEKLTSFPTAPKLVVTPSWSIRPLKELREIPERLHVEYVGGEGVVHTILEVLSKRWQTQDLISIMKEVQRTVARYGGNKITKITDNLSVIPRFQPTPEQT